MCEDPPVSIHAPVMGATLHGGDPAVHHRGFYPRPRDGGDLENGLHPVLIEVSIHAPVMGATVNPEHWMWWVPFLSTPP